MILDARRTSRSSARPATARGGRAGRRRAARRRADGRAHAGHGRHRATRRIVDVGQLRAGSSSSRRSTLDEYVYAALRAGASGFLLKDVRPARAGRGVRVVARGDALLAPASPAGCSTASPARCPTAPTPPPDLGELTEREREVLRLRGARAARTRRSPRAARHRGDRQDARLARCCASSGCATASRRSCSPTTRARAPALILKSEARSSILAPECAGAVTAADAGGHDPRRRPLHQALRPRRTPSTTSAFNGPARPGHRLPRARTAPARPRRCAMLLGPASTPAPTAVGGRATTSSSPPPHGRRGPRGRELPPRPQRPQPPARARGGRRPSRPARGRGARARSGSPTPPTGA